MSTSIDAPLGTAIVTNKTMKSEGGAAVKFALAIVVTLSLCGCSPGSAQQSLTAPPLTAPTPPPTPNYTPATVTILFSNGQGSLGAQSFSPNPSYQSYGGVVWHNSDTTLHHIVSDDGLFDTGAIAPGSTSDAMSSQLDVRYHCTIHPTEVGTVTGVWGY